MVEGGEVRGATIAEAVNKAQGPTIAEAVKEAQAANQATETLKSVVEKLHKNKGKGKGKGKGK